MKSVACALALLLPFGLVTVAGCAVGEATGDPSVDYLSSATVDAGDDDDEGTIRIPESPSGPSDDEGATDAGAPGTGDGVGDPGTGDDGGTGGGSGTGGSTIACDATIACSGAPNLGSVSGDTGAQSLSKQGQTSDWFTVRVTEDHSSIGGRTLFMLATLTLPPGADFDLYAYFPGSNKGFDCNGDQFKAKPHPTEPGKKFLGLEWGEFDLISNGVDDGRTLVFEVRHVSGTCNTAQSWTVLVEGNDP